MKAVILAAGIGSRLRPLTNDKPKCLVRICGKSLLEYQLDAHRVAGVKDIYIVVGYEAQAVRDYCKHIKDLNIHIVESVNYETTNNMYSLYLLREHLKGEAFILNNADLAIDNEIVNKMVQDKRQDLIMVDTSQYNDESMKISVDKKGVITDISKKIDEKNSYGCSIDYYKFSPETSKTLFAEVERTVEKEENLNQWTEVALQELMQARAISMEPIHTDGLRWMEVDNYEDLAIADMLFSDFDTTFADIDALFLDLDGTVYLGGNIIPGSDAFIQKMQKLGKKVYFLSNNSSKDKKQYVTRLKKLGIKAKEEDVILSTDGLIHYLKEKKVESVYVVGTKALSAQIEESGIRVTDEKPEYVVVGYDTELTYEKLVKASQLMHAGVEVIATHCDTVCPTDNGPVPDAGAILEMLRVTTGKEALKIFGKPEPSMVTFALDANEIDPQRAVMIGDRLYTDMKLAELAGMKSLLVLSGETSRDDIEQLEEYPTLTVSSLAKLV